MRILLAEDDDDLRNFLARGLSRAGYDVHAVADGMEAMTAINGEDSYDLLIADIVMPGIDGIELVRRASAEKPKLRVMFITGFAAVAMRARAMPGARVLSKPFHLKDLVSQVKEILAA
jgi:two-component system, cell cycle response regulator CpdR